MTNDNSIKKQDRDEMVYAMISPGKYYHMSTPKVFFFQDGYGKFRKLFKKINQVTVNQGGTLNVRFSYDI